MFEKIKKWYKQGLWTEQMVMSALNKGILTDAQKEEILSAKEE